MPKCVDFEKAPKARADIDVDIEVDIDVDVLKARIRPQSPGLLVLYPDGFNRCFDCQIRTKGKYACPRCGGWLKAGIHTNHFVDRMHEGRSLASLSTEEAARLKADSRRMRRAIRSGTRERFLKIGSDWPILSSLSEVAPSTRYRRR